MALSLVIHKKEPSEERLYRQRDRNKEVKLGQRLLSLLHPSPSPGFQTVYLTDVYQATPGWLL